MIFPPQGNIMVGLTGRQLHYTCGPAFLQQEKANESPHTSHLLRMGLKKNTNESP